MSRRIVVETYDTATPAQWQAFSDCLERAGWTRTGDQPEWVTKLPARGFAPAEAVVRLAMEAASMTRAPDWHTGRSITPMMRPALRDDVP